MSRSPPTDRPHRRPGAHRHAEGSHGAGQHAGGARVELAFHQPPAALEQRDRQPLTGQPAGRLQAQDAAAEHGGAPCPPSERLDLGAVGERTERDRARHQPPAATSPAAGGSTALLPVASTSTS